MKLYFGNLDPKVDEKLLYELAIQAAPVVSVSLPKDKVTRLHQGFAFVEFEDAAAAAYVQQVLGSTRLYGKPLRINSSNKSTAVFAEIFIGNLDQLVDERTLDQALGAFGRVDRVEVVRDTQGISRGHAFAVLESFAVADRVIAEMHGQFILNKPCSVEYAVRNGRRAGGEADRRLEHEQKRRSERNEA